MNQSRREFLAGAGVTMAAMEFSGCRFIGTYLCGGKVVSVKIDRRQET